MMAVTYWLLGLCTVPLWCVCASPAVVELAQTATPKAKSHPEFPRVDSGVTVSKHSELRSVPPDVTSVNVVNRSTFSLELEWAKVNNDSNFIYLLTNTLGDEFIVFPSESDRVTHTLSSLSPGAKYSYTLFTVLNDVRSKGFQFSTVTTPPDVAAVDVVSGETHLELQWAKVNNNNNYNYILRYSNRTETTIIGSATGSTVTHTVSSLSPVTNYIFTLYTVFEGERSTGYQVLGLTSPPPVPHVRVVNRSETHLELQWDKVNNSNYDYILRHSNGTETTITGSDAGTTVTHTVSSLSPGTEYSFTLYTVFEGVKSTGFQFTEVTTPSDAKVEVVGRSETHLELQWDKVNNNSNYDYILRDSNGTETNISGSDAGTTVTHTVSSLSPETNHSFTLFTVFKGLLSKGYNFSESTVNNCANGKWTTTNTTIEGEVPGMFSMATATNGSDADAVNGTVEGNKVFFSNLYPGATYKVSLFQEKHLLCSLSLCLVPATVTGLRCGESGDYSIGLKWEEPYGVWTGLEVSVSKKGSHSVTQTALKVAELQPAQTYSFSVTSLSGVMRSSPVELKCKTTATVIWVPVLVIILVGLLAAVGVFVYRKKLKLPREKEEEDL